MNILMILLITISIRNQVFIGIFVSIHEVIVFYLVNFVIIEIISFIFMLFVLTNIFTIILA